MDAIETYEVGDKVKHPKFGQGTVIVRSGDGESQKLTIKFGGEVGEKKIVVRFAKMKKLQERPTLPAAPAAEAATAPVGVVAATRRQVEEEEVDDEPLEIEGEADEDADEEVEEEEE